MQECKNKDLCTEKKYDILHDKASSVKLDWELKFDEDNNHYFEVTAYDISEDLIFKYGGITYEPIDGRIKFYNFFNGNNT